MNKIYTLLLLMTIFLSLSIPQKVEAQLNCVSTEPPSPIEVSGPIKPGDIKINFDTSDFETALAGKGTPGRLTFSFPGILSLNPDCHEPSVPGGEIPDDNAKKNIRNPITLDPTSCPLLTSVGNHIVQILYKYPGAEPVICRGSYEITLKPLTRLCTVDAFAIGNQDINDSTWQVRITNIISQPEDQKLQISYIRGDGYTFGPIDRPIADTVLDIPPEIYKTAGTHRVIASLYFFDMSEVVNECGNDSFRVLIPGQPTPSSPPPTPTPDLQCQTDIIGGTPVPTVCARPECATHPDCVALITPTPPGIKAKDICEQIDARCPSLAPTPQEQCKQDAQMCLDCFAKRGAWTALGCIKTDVGPFVRDLFRIILGVAGGIAFLLLLGGGFKIMVSRGDAEQLADGQQTITAAVFGLIFVFLAVFILKIIGVDILGLPGFGPD